MKLFPSRLRAINPLCIVRTPNVYGEQSVKTEKVSGLFFLVHPATPREIAYLGMLEHCTDKFAPAQGNGVYVRAEKLVAA